MNYKINGDLPIKYELNVHKKLLSYPTHQDFMFDIISYLLKNDKSNELNQIKEFKFSPKTLKYVFGENLKNDQFFSMIKEILRDLIESSVLKKEDSQFFINSSEIKKYYTLI